MLLENLKLIMPLTPQYPEFNSKEFFAKTHRFCLCIFVINENQKLIKQLSKIQQLKLPLDIIIADGGSTDGSTEESLLKSLNVRCLLIKTGPGKLSAQMRMAFYYSLKEGYEGIITMDGNNKDDPSSISLFMNELEKGGDHIQGSRFILGGYHENTPLSRLLAVKCIHAPLISLASGFRYTDTTNGFRAYSSSFLSDSRTSIFRDIFMRYELHYYLAIQACKLGFKVSEVPTSRVYPATGKTPTKISPLKGNFEVLITLFKAVMGIYNP
jgi:dolichol-phosphate mannosyltransferase